jgi:hypothetical protein
MGMDPVGARCLVEQGDLARNPTPERQSLNDGLFWYKPLAPDKAASPCDGRITSWATFTGFSEELLLGFCFDSLY